MRSINHHFQSVWALTPMLSLFQLLGVKLFLSSSQMQAPPATLTQPGYLTVAFCTEEAGETARLKPWMPLHTAVWSFTLQSSLKTHWWRYRQILWWYCEVLFLTFTLLNIPHRTVPLFYLFFPQQAHTDALTDLRFTLAFVYCVMELASSKDPGPGAISSPDVSFLEQSLVTDQISLLSKEWRWEAWSFVLFFLLKWLRCSVTEPIPPPVGEQRPTRDSFTDNPLTYVSDAAPIIYTQFLLTCLRSQEKWSALWHVLPLHLIFWLYSFCLLGQPGEQWKCVCVCVVWARAQNKFQGSLLVPYLSLKSTPQYHINHKRMLPQALQQPQHRFKFSQI